VPARYRRRRNGAASSFTFAILESAMAKNTAKQPDKKEVDKTVKNIKAACEQLKECGKDLKGAMDAAKELDKLLR